jgi:dTDP-4-dehydrorhamnose reductase
MAERKILVLGDGLLGSEIVKQTDWDWASRKNDGIDFRNMNSYVHILDYYNEIVNCIAYTNTYSNEKDLHWDTNYEAVTNLVDYCLEQEKKLIHVSTDYVYTNNPMYASEEDPPANCANWYTYTKSLADGYIQLKMWNYLIVRTSFKPRPFPYQKAIFQFGNFDYVDVIAGLIIQLINKNAYDLFNVGTSYKSMFELAKQTREDVEEVLECIHITQPLDVSMNVDKMNRFLNE